MQLNMTDVYDKNGKVISSLSNFITGHKEEFALTHGLTLVFQHISCKQDISISESAKANVYISLLSDKKVNSVEDFSSVQISLFEQDFTGTFMLKAGETKSLLQLQIDINKLAQALNESADTLIQHMKALTYKIAVDRKNIVMPITQRLSGYIAPLMNAAPEKRLSLVGQAYALTFLVLEQMQMLSHMLSCSDCQSKLFSVQNLLEADSGITKEFTEFAYQVGLNVDALELGFHHIVGETIFHYRDQMRLKRAAAMLRTDQYSRSDIVAKTGFSEAQLETLFIRHFGVPIAQYGQIH